MLCKIFRKITKTTRRVIGRVRNAALRQRARMRMRAAPVMIGFRVMSSDVPALPTEGVNHLFSTSVAAAMIAAHHLPRSVQFMNSDISVFVERLVF